MAPSDARASWGRPGHLAGHLGIMLIRLGIRRLRQARCPHAPRCPDVPGCPAAPPVRRTAHRQRHIASRWRDGISVLRPGMRRAAIQVALAGRGRGRVRRKMHGSRALHHGWQHFCRHRRPAKPGHLWSRGHLWPRARCGACVPRPSEASAGVQGHSPIFSAAQRGARHPGSRLSLACARSSGTRGFSREHPETHRCACAGPAELSFNARHMSLPIPTTRRRGSNQFVTSDVTIVYGVRKAAGRGMSGMKAPENICSR